jgi:Rrf2 family iron-sulfur cluster assembly transcriptional regulator
MADLAGHDEGKPVALAEIAQRQAISLSYLEQLFARLRRAALVKSVRGPGGGYVLGRAADALAIAEIVRAVEEAEPAAEGAPASGHAAALWGELGKQVENFLSAVTLADLRAGKLPAPARVERPDRPGAPLAAE